MSSLFLVILTKTSVPLDRMMERLLLSGYWLTDLILFKSSPTWFPSWSSSTLLLVSNSTATIRFISAPSVWLLQMPSHWPLLFLGNDGLFVSMKAIPSPVPFCGRMLSVNCVLKDVGTVCFLFHSLSVSFAYTILPDLWLKSPVFCTIWREPFAIAECGLKLKSSLLVVSKLG